MRKIGNDRQKAVAQGILKFSEQHPRNLPWKQTNDPYKIWISEIILQQTRVAQGIGYYEEFTRRFPTVFHLAEATIDQVYKAWEGLGYYRRAAHLLETAKVIVNEYGGQFPSTYEKILSLKGIGPYTAAAIASFAFGRPCPVIDGNVSRVIARIEGIRDPIDMAKGQQSVRSSLHRFFDWERPAVFNQAIMDFGALRCKPRKPDCQHCEVAKHCRSLAKDLVEFLPQKKGKKARIKRFFNYLVLKDGKDVWIRRRANGDIWQNLYEFYLIEQEFLLNWSAIEPQLPFAVQHLSTSKEYRQTLTHQEINAQFIELKFQGDPKELETIGFGRINRKKIRNFAFPRIIDCYLGDNALLLN